MFLRQNIDCYIAQECISFFQQRAVYLDVRRLKKTLLSTTYFSCYFYKCRNNRSSRSSPTRTSDLISEKRNSRIAHLVTTKGERDKPSRNNKRQISCYYFQQYTQRYIFTHDFTRYSIFYEEKYSVISIIYLH